jgi:hypothetical protein
VTLIGRDGTKLSANLQRIVETIEEVDLENGPEWTNPTGAEKRDAFRHACRR